MTVRMILALMSCLSATPFLLAQPKGDTVDFAHDVVPILKAKCAKCHTNGTYKGGAVARHPRGPAEVEGRRARASPRESELIKRITQQRPRRAHAAARATRSPAKEIAVLTKWIDDGLPWEAGVHASSRATYVAPLKPRRSTLPPRAPGREHPIDRILDAYFAANKVDAAAAARRRGVRPPRLPRPDRPAAGRRANSTRSSRTRTRDKRAKLVRQLLAEDRAYADHWLTFWNDLLRNDYAGTGYIDGGRKQITALALQVAAGEQAVRPVRPRTDQPDAGLRGLHQGHQVARRRSTPARSSSCSSRRTSGRCSSART